MVLCILPSSRQFLKSSIAKAAEGKLPRQRCEAITKSGNRCKRNVVSGERLCPQYRKILGMTEASIPYPQRLAARALANGAAVTTPRGETPRVR